MCTERRYLKAGKHQNMIKFPWNNHTGAINLYLKGELEYEIKNNFHHHLSNAT